MSDNFTKKSMSPDWNNILRDKAQAQTQLGFANTMSPNQPKN